MVTQLPTGSAVEKQGPACGGMLRASYGDRGRLVLVSPDSRPRVLTSRFHSACDPDVSFDGRRILFAGKKRAAEPWNIYEMAVDGREARQITRDLGDCRSPGYQSTLYTLKPVGVPNEPEYHVTFVAGTGTRNELGGCEATALYSCKLDGSAVRRLTYNLSSDLDPFIMDDGRLVFASWQRARLDHGLLGRVALFGVNLDGTDYALYAGHEGRRIKQMACATAGGLLVFVEAEAVPWDGAGQLASVTIRRPLHSYRPITRKSDGLFHSPSPLPDGRLLVSRRPCDGSRSHGIWRLDPLTGRAEPVFDDPRYHEIQAKLIHPRDEPDGRSTAVSEEPSTSELSGKLYCLNVYTSDLAGAKLAIQKDLETCAQAAQKSRRKTLKRSWMPPGSVKRLRVLEGVPLEFEETDASLPGTEGIVGSAAGSAPAGYPRSAVHGNLPLVQRRILGEIPVQEDGSFNIEVPANTPIELQILDADGIALRSCGWIWVKDFARQGCVGCHEDPELVPENSFVDALGRPSIPLVLPPERRRTVDFRRDVMPILANKCAPCHDQGDKPIYLDGDLKLVAGPDGTARFNRTYENLLVPRVAADPDRPWGKYVHPGRARTSLLAWRVLGRNTSRPWDGSTAQGPVKPMPPAGAERLTEDEKRTIVEWIDLGALWDGIPGPDRFPGKKGNLSGDKR